MIDQGLTLPQMLLLGLMGAVALLLVVIRTRFAMWLVGGMLFASALGVPLDSADIVIRLWALPLQAARTNVYLGAAALLMLGALVHIGRMKFGRISGAGVAMMAVGVYAALIKIAAGNAEDGLQSIAFAALTIPALVVVIPSLLDEWEDFYALLRVIAITSMVWAGGVFLQFVIDWKKLVVQHGLSRFHGLLANPQHAAAFTSVTTVVCLFLLLNDPKTRYKLLWAGLAAVNGVFVLWTGSRTGLGMLVIGLTSVLYARMGRAILFLPIVALMGALAFDFLSGSQVEIDIARFTQGGDTRSGVWRRLIEEIAMNPAIGIGEPKDIPSENSYLYGMAAYGVGMGGMIFLLAAACGVQATAIWRRKRLLPVRERRLVELVIGFYGMYFGGAMFEGYIVARVSTMLVFLLIFTAIGARLSQITKNIERQALYGEGEPEPPDEVYGHEGEGGDGAEQGRGAASWA